MSPQLKGLYGRVARRLGVGVSYVSQVANGELESQPVEAALRDELTKIVNRANKKHSLRQKAPREKGARKRGRARKKTKPR